MGAVAPKEKKKFLCDNRNVQVMLEATLSAKYKEEFKKKKLYNSSGTFAFK